MNFNSVVKMEGFSRAASQNSDFAVSSQNSQPLSMTFRPICVLSSQRSQHTQEPERLMPSYSQNSQFSFQNSQGPSSSAPPNPLAKYSRQYLQNEIDRQKAHAKERIEELILQMLGSIANNQFPEFERPRLITNSKDIIKVTQNPELSTKIKFGGRSSKTFAMQVYLMSVVYRMIEHRQTSTTRDLFYQNLNFFGNQNRLSVAIKQLSLLLGVPREGLCIEASAKGLVAGQIQFISTTGEVIDASASRHGILVPNKLHELTIQTNAKCILFVEKDATFQRLLDEQIFEVLSPIILITGKGYPDIQTRRLMCILNRIHGLKVYAMVDCDPYGIEIAAVVKFGSYRNGSVGGEDENCYLSSDLSVPDLIWLGLLPSELAPLALTLNASKQLTEKDKKKLESLTDRINLQKDHSWLQEINFMKHRGVKTELEALFTSHMFTTRVYLPSKLGPVMNSQGGGN